MGIPSIFYSIVSRVAAVVLLIAGGLKAQEFLTLPTLVPQWSVLGQTVLELFLGLLLLVGLYPRWSRIFAFVLFFIFLNVALLGALQGKTSCGCFGAAPVRPWSAVGLDALLLGGLILSPTSGLRESTPRTMRLRWFAFVVPAFLVLLVLGWSLVRRASFGEKSIATKATDNIPSGIDATALELVIQGVEQNHAAIHTIVYTTEAVKTKYPVKWTGVRPMRDGNRIVQVTGTWVEPKKEKSSRHSWKTWIRGDEVRQECLTHYEDGPGGEILISSKGKRIQYAPEIRQAWISTAEVADAGYSDSIDLRCAGLEPPLKSIADWLKNRCELLNAGIVKDQSGREVIRIRARVKKHGKYESEVTADFVPTMNCVPSRVVKYFLPDGGVFNVTDIKYQRIGPNGAWFPFRIAQRSFPRNATSDPDAPTGQNLSGEYTVKVLAFGQSVQDEDFDPILPAKTLLTGDLRTETITGNTPVRASKVTRTKPRSVADATPLRQEVGVRTTFWPFAAGMDVILLGFCLAFRKRLAF